MQRRIEIDGVTYICNVTHSDDTEYWSCSNAEKLAKFLEKNGCEVRNVITNILPNRIEVNRSIRFFNNECYWLNPCEGDLFEWFNDSLEGDFTYYYDKVVFNTIDGFVAAYRDDITNIIKI